MDPGSFVQGAMFGAGLTLLVWLCIEVRDQKRRRQRDRTPPDPQ